MTATGQFLGTPSYMPPEQISTASGEVGPAADVYSLGATLYALLTGRPPFQSASAVDTLKQVLEKQPVALREFDVNLPRNLETIALKCLEKQPSRRYASTKCAGRRAKSIPDRPANPCPTGGPHRASLSLVPSQSGGGELDRGMRNFADRCALVATFFAVQSNHRAKDNLDLAKQERTARTDAQLQQQRAEQNGGVGKTATTQGGGRMVHQCGVICISPTYEFGTNGVGEKPHGTRSTLCWIAPSRNRARKICPASNGITGIASATAI